MNKNSKIIVSVITLVLLSATVLALIQLNSPSACSGQWTTCSNAFANDASRATATATNTVNKSGVWNNYGFSISNSSSINNVTIRADFFASTTKGKINVRVSSDGGATFGPNHVVGGNTAEQTFLIDVTNDVAWTASKLNNGNLVINATCFKTTSGGTNPVCNLDWVPVNVTSTPFDFSVVVNPSSAVVVQANSAVTVVNVSLLSGISQNVTLSQIGCPTDAICTFNADVGLPSYESNFTVSTAASTPAGVYTINITGTGDGKTRNTMFTLNVTDSLPVATANAVPTSGVAPLTVNFNGTVSGGDAPFTYFWDFKDGTNSTLQNPQHVFNNAGTYNVSFTATDFDGDNSNSIVVITVNDQFDFSVSVSPLSDSVVQGNNVSTLATVSLLSGLTEQVNLSYAGCPVSATCFFSISSGNPTYNSTFTVATTASTTAATYVINVTGQSAGLTRVTTYNLNVTDSLPVATVNAVPTSGDVPLTVDFNGTVFGGDAPLTYFWDFKDGTNSTLQNPQHVFNNAGTYNVTFTVIDSDNDQSIDNVVITVNEPCVRANPLVKSTSDYQNATSGSTLLYFVNVTNTDSVNCGESKFSFSAAVPLFWDYFYWTNNLMINPGVSVVANFSLTSVNATQGIYNFTNTAVNNNASSFSGNDTALYHVI